MNKKRILLVEDTELFRESVADGLRQAGYSVRTAENGRAALEELKSNLLQFDLIIVDLAMPEMTGFELLDRVSKTGWSEIPVFMLTAAIEKEFVVKAHQYKVREYLIKSTFSLDELLTLIAKHINHPR